MAVVIRASSSTIRAISGTTSTVGGGGQSPSAGLSVGILFSPNANSNWSLTNWFGYGGIGGGVGPGGSITVLGGIDNCNRGVIGGELDFTGSVGLPVEVHGWASYTTYQDWKGPLQSAWNKFTNWWNSIPD